MPVNPTTKVTEYLRDGELKEQELGGIFSAFEMAKRQDPTMYQRALDWLEAQSKEPSNKPGDQKIYKLLRDSIRILEDGNDKNDSPQNFVLTYVKLGGTVAECKV